MTFKKITEGFVIQTYNNGKCVHQEFVAGDQCNYEDEAGNRVDPPKDEEYQPYTMVNNMAADNMADELQKKHGRLQYDVLRRIQELEGILQRMKKNVEDNDAILNDLGEMQGVAPILDARVATLATVRNMLKEAGEKPQSLLMKVRKMKGITFILPLMGIHGTAP